MKNIFSIYKTDLSRIVTNWAAAVIIGGLVVLPSLYAWFNIEASWDPYGNTKGIQIAVANNDAGTTILNKPINIGREIIASLKENHSIGWMFMDEKEAYHGVQHGDYYASIVIPKDFSARIGTVLTDNPIKAEIEYYVNEKINAISPKITSKGASSIIEQVSSNFVKTANGTIFEIFNEVGVELKNELPTIEKVRSLVFKLEQNFPQISQAVDTALTDVSKSNEIVAEAKQNLPLVAQIAEEGATFAQGVSELLTYSNQGLETIAPYIKQDIGSIEQTAIAAQDVTSLLQDAKAKPSLVLKSLERTDTRLQAAIRVSSGLADWFQRLGRLLPGGPSLITNQVQGMTNKLEQQQSIVNQLLDAVRRGENASDELISRLNSAAASTADISRELYNRFDTEIAPEIKQGMKKAQQTVQNTNKVLQQGISRMPDVKKILDDASKALVVGSKEIKAIKSSLPAVQGKIKDVADKIRAIEARGDINEIIDLLKNNFEKESEFFAEPVRLKENKLYPIPNYGSAMSPFFTTLSLWVGALLLVSLLTVEVHEEGASYKDYQIYFGRYLTFLTIALLQSFFVTVGDMYILGAYVLNKSWFVLFGLLISSVFMLIVYTLVSVFGNVGKALAIVLLVLQLAGSGGTFPIQVTPPFFQAIYPYLPFTYAISMMREAVGGILWDIIQRDLLMMVIYAGIFLVIGLALKTSINRSSAVLVKKAKESKLIH
ncbi:YhgE/Pip domain-containing protein [Paenibacillus sp. ACRRX]|uniref:YhgE/Pip domain-containing protein n=1 Tax=unclassified Paenibacillus TaxID=185978 RepID=UPI001EF475A6|nr:MULTISPECIES: YhgE/Pip domain-containing protein [unclassified Paenibacillus]MCG7408165.1 YhgE/Pip domain-containing protein [Paenibacillus sp. ACRRX]MDK8181452.1 YhgE/Pip domain-containing protein [Paenibacillus sp. UMB4589-SE434]